LPIPDGKSERCRVVGLRFLLGGDFSGTDSLKHEFENRAFSAANADDELPTFAGRACDSA
jgi:hypothetical protein